MGKVLKVKPTDIPMLKYIYGIISSKFDISWELFMQCRDSVFAYIENDYGCNMFRDNIRCIAICRRTTMDEIGIDKVAYRCKQYGIIYSIDCLYLSNDDLGKDASEYAAYRTINSLSKDLTISYKPGETDQSVNPNDSSEVSTENDDAPNELSNEEKAAARTRLSIKPEETVFGIFGR